MKNSTLYSLILAALAIASALLFHKNPDNFLADDAYFYPQIADQIIQGHGSTFHQFSSTNGYQPLWMVFNIAAAWISQGDKVLLLHLLGVIQIALYLISIYILFKISEFLDLRFFSTGMSFLTVIMLALGGLRLFEAHLAIALQLGVCYLFLLLKERPLSGYSLIAMSVLLGLVFLARTDAFFFSAAIGIAIGLRALLEQTNIKSKIGNLCAIALPALAMAFLYMGINKHYFGHPVPISGVIKSSFPHPNFDWNALGMQGQIIVIATLSLLFAAACLSGKEKNLQVLFGLAFCGVFFHAAYLLLFSWGSQWHYTTAFTIIPIALEYLFTYAWRRLYFSKGFSQTIYICNACVLMLFVCVGYMKTYYHFSVSLVVAGKQSILPSNEKSARLKLVDEINKHIQPGEGVAVFDSPGVLAYFTHARILPLDGLVNDRRYDEWLSQKGVGDYFEKNQIKYFLAASLLENQEYRSSTLHTFRQGTIQHNIVYAPIGKIPVGDLPLEDSQIIFTTSNPIPGNHVFKDVSCWQLYSPSS